MASSLEIAQAARLQPIVDVAEQAGIVEDELELYGRYKAKVSHSVLDRLAAEPDGELVVGDGDHADSRPARARRRRRSRSPRASACSARSRSLCLREPSLGPVFGIKGGAAGGGYAQVVPMEDLNLHFTGDLHAITAANNLLAAMIDAHLLQGNELGIDPHSITWRRCLDMNDRSLRQVVIGLGGRIERRSRARPASTSPPPPR